MNTHLYAKKVDLNAEIKLIFNTQVVKYECIFSCRPANLALEEVLDNWKTYEENFEALKEAGQLCLPSSEIKDELKSCENIELFDNINWYDQVSKNKKKIIIQPISVIDIINSNIQDIKNKYGKNPDIKVVGITSNGGPICGLFIGNTLISNYGYSMILSDTMEKIYQLVKIT